MPSTVRLLPCLLILLCVAAQAPALSPAPALGDVPPVDAFGIEGRYPSRDGTREWSSLHWSEGGARTLDGRDPFDPSGWSQRRGTGSVSIDGSGVASLAGTQPRLYINPYPDGSSDPAEAEQRFIDTEVSVWFRRVSAAGASYGGLVVGLRSGPMGHGAAGGDNCGATTHYARLRNDGGWDFAKELRHPAAAAMQAQPVWSGEPLPLNQWIGLRYVAYTPVGGGVKLELWIDRDSGGAGGGDFELLGSYHDTGQWNADASNGQTDASGCSYDADALIEPGGGVVLIRNTSDLADEPLSEYRWLSIREIVAPDSERIFVDGLQ